MHKRTHQFWFCFILLFQYSAADVSRPILVMENYIITMWWLGVPERANDQSI